MTDPRRWPDDREAQARHHEFLRARGPIPPLAGCPIGWQPSALAPVFHGNRTYGAADGAPATLRVFFPSADWPDSDVLMLEGCGRYPVILFAHGQCEGDEHPYQRWFRLPAQLARSGYVVVVPELSGIDAHPTQAQAVQQVLSDALVWIRASWEHRESLMPEPATGLAGHSYGALHAGNLGHEDPGRRRGVAQWGLERLGPLLRRALADLSDRATPSVHVGNHPAGGAMESTHEPVAVLGIGAMGHGMATSALRADIGTIVWNRNSAATRDLAALGAEVAETAADAGRRAGSSSPW